MRRYMDAALAWIVAIFVSILAVTGVYLWVDQERHDVELKRKQQFAALRDEDPKAKEWNQEQERIAEAPTEELPVQDEDKSQPEPAAPQKTPTNLCKIGELQSPIHLKLSPHPQKAVPLRFSYQSGDFDILQQARIITPAKKAMIQELYFNDRRFVLESISIRSPSEHMLEGDQYELEVQMQHKSADGGWLVLATLVRAGSQSAWPRPLTHYYRMDEDLRPRRIQLNPLDMLPSELSYLLYRGSLTEAPCTEDVDWLVMLRPLTIGVEDFEVIRRQLSKAPRPLQPPNGRKAVLRQK